VIETPEELFRRVARNIAQADLNTTVNMLLKPKKPFFSLMVSLDFMPNSPT